ncbi:MAG: putative oxidoreductase C-terminal domain-containing protein [Bryobacteraceae bacterium]
MKKRAIFEAMLLPFLLTAQSPRQPARLIIMEPGHFHASLLQAEMYPGLDERVSVYAPLGPELFDYLNRIYLFNTRPQNPTRWKLDVHATADPMAEMLKDPPGNVVVLTGRNRGKIDRILASLAAGLNVFCDKPWIIHSADLPKLEKALDMADRKGLVAYDIMTERYEATSEVQRILVNTPEVFGAQAAGAVDAPGISASSIHHIKKVVAGVPLRRPAWFFDIDEYGEALADVGTHVIDLVSWTAFPGQAIDYRKDIQVLSGRRWPLMLTRARFQEITGEPDFPPPLAAQVKGGELPYFCNNAVDYTLRGIHVKLEILWHWEAPQGSGDVYQASFLGSKARIEIRQGVAENFKPELYVLPVGDAAPVWRALRAKVAALQAEWPGLAVITSGAHPAEARIDIPARFRVGHEAHFAQVANRFLGYLKSPKTLPAWERPDMLAKYYVSTKGVELAPRRSR